MTLLVAVFKETTDRPGRIITYEEAPKQLILQGHGPITAQDVLNFDASGQIDWAKERLHDWVHEFATWERTYRLKAHAVDTTASPTLKTLRDLGRMVQELALINQDTNRPSREAAAEVAARCSSLIADIDAWRAYFPEANPSTLRLCDASVTFARAIAAVLLISKRPTKSEVKSIALDYQNSRAAFNEATGEWYGYVEQLASAEGTRLSFDFG
jgi:hypothetical protein